MSSGGRKSQARVSPFCVSFFVMLLQALLIPAAAVAGAAAGEPLRRLYIDADYSGNREASLGLEYGVAAAVRLAGGEAAGMPIEIVPLNNHGNSVRSRLHYERAADDPAALAVIVGPGSAVVGECEVTDLLKGLPLVVPLTSSISAGTRGCSVFRLVPDDLAVARLLCGRARGRGFSRPVLMLSDDYSGRSLREAVAEVALSKGESVPGVRWIQRGMNERTLRVMLRTAVLSAFDCIILSAPAEQCGVFFRAMLSLPPRFRLPVISHWHLASNDFIRAVPESDINRLRLEFLYSRTEFPDVGQSGPGGGEAGLGSRMRQALEVERPGAVQTLGTAPMQLLYAFDAVRLLLKAAERAGSSGVGQGFRRSLRGALASGAGTVSGLNARYDNSFGSGDGGGPLVGNLGFYRFDRGGEIVAADR